MNAKTILGEIRKKQIELDVTNADLMRVTGWSKNTYCRRVASPDTIRLGEVIAICNYLGIKNF